MSAAFIGALGVHARQIRSTIEQSQFLIDRFQHN